MSRIDAADRSLRQAVILPGMSMVAWPTIANALVDDEEAHRPPLSVAEAVIHERGLARHVADALEAHPAPAGTLNVWTPRIAFPGR